MDSVMLPDGTFVMCWLEMSAPAAGRPGGICLRKLSRAGRLTEPQLVAPGGTSRMSGFPRMVLLDGQRLLLTCTQEGEPSLVRTFLVDLN